MTQEEDLLFVNVAGSDELRRELLESSRNIVEILKNFENFKSLNGEKYKQIANLKSKLNEISRLMNQLKTVLPSVKMKAHKKAKKEEVRPVVEPVSELNALEQELNDIESKLRTLS